MSKHTTDAFIHEDDRNRPENSATYCPEDNKIRLYIDGGDGRVARETYNFLVARKFKATAKQDCSFVATWSTAAEDIALALIHESDDLGDEDTSPQQRSVDRAERFATYREKRRAEAGDLADRYDSAPDAYGHQNARRAQRAAIRRDRIGDRAGSQWSKAEYWHSRTDGVISHALHKASAAVRRGRILTIEKDLRRLEKQIAESQEIFDKWQLVATLHGGDSFATDSFLQSEWGDDAHTLTTETVAFSLAYKLAAYKSHGQYAHPRTGTETSLCSMLCDADNPITPREASELYLLDRQRPGATGSRSDRWSLHYRLRLEYENAMLASEGGKVTDVDIVPGGWFGKTQVQGVNKSPATGRVVSVKVNGQDHRGNPAVISINVERLGADAYRAPTAEELKAFKAAKNANNPKTIPFLNPTKKDAEKLQAIFNAGCDRPGSVKESTQAKYSARAKTSDWIFPVFVTNDGDYVYYKPDVNKAKADGTLLFKVRTDSNGFTGARNIIVLTDKPTKPLPFDQFVDVPEAVTTNTETGE